MISVSDGFKKAIKKNDRRIYGYVDVKYQNKSFDKVETQIPTRLDILSNNWLLVNKKIVQKYATLENNYTLLDGSFMVWNENSLVENGYATQDIFENINNNTIIITNNSTSTTSKAVSIYFKENLPFDFNATINFRDGSLIVDEVRNNQTYNYQYIFTDEKVINNVEIQILNVEFPKNRLRISSVDFNMGDIYEGEELISFDVTEELDLLGEKLPINTCLINLNNYPDNSGGSKFDPINPKAIVKYLDNNTSIEPYIGVLTEDKGVEYVTMGTFYLKDWSSDADGNVTINGESVLSKLKDVIIKPTNDFLSSTAKSTSDLEAVMKNSIDANVYLIGYSNTWSNLFLQNEYLLDYLSSILSYLLYFDNFSTPYAQYRKFFVDRDNYITLNELNLQSVDSIPRNLLIGDVEYITNNKIKQINVSQNGYGIYSNFRSSTIVSTSSYTLTSAEEYLWFKSNNRLVDDTLSLSASVVSGSANASIVGYNSRMICVKLTGTIGSVISIGISGSICDEQSSSSSDSFYNTNAQNGEIITVNLVDFVNVSTDYYKNVFFGLDKNYKINAKTMGNPSIVIGDTISIQTRYTDINDGYKDMIVTKQHFKFDGGLTCELEGVGD